MKTDHNLIDREDPICLYCGKRCVIDYHGTRVQNTVEDCDILTCQGCQETFRVNSVRDPAGETTYTEFNFTCKDYTVIYKYADDKFVIRDKDRKDIATIPTFEVDFSDKKRLHEKLKTYIIFS
jgi:hypothetical protein